VQKIILNLAHLFKSRPENCQNGFILSVYPLSDLYSILTISSGFNGLKRVQV